MADDNAKELAKRGNALFEKKRILDSRNQEIALQFYPERADFTAIREIDGDEFATHLFDSHPVLCRRDLCDSFSAILRPQGQPWFKQRVADEELMEIQPVQVACDTITKRLRQLIYRPQAQFSRATKEADHDYGTFGNAVIAAGESRRGGLLYRSYHLRDCAWIEGPDGDIRDGGALWRKEFKSARNIKAWFPNADLHQSIKDALDKEPDKEFELCHVMIPTDEYYGKRRNDEWGRKLPYMSVWYDPQNCMTLSEEGRAEFLYVVPRWHTLAGTQYAVSPAAIAMLADARGLQTMARILLEAGEKAVDPPLKATSEAILGDVNLYSGGVTWVERDYDERLGPAIEPIQLGKQISIGADLLMMMYGKQKDGWFLSRMTLPPGDRRTATEIIQLNEEYVRSNIPLFEPIGNEYNAPLLDASCQVALRTDQVIKAAVAQIRMHAGDDRELDIEHEFSNPLQDVIERNKANQVQILTGAVAGAMSIDPNSVRVHDWPYIIRDLTTAIGAPAKWNLDPEVEAEKQAAAAQAEDVLSGLGVAEQAAGIVETGTNAAANLQGIMMPEAA